MSSLEFQALTVRFHQQDDGTLCGEATAQMTLGAIGVQVDQGDLRCQLNRPGNGTTPEELQKLLNDNLQSGGPKFTLPFDRSPSKAVQRIFSTLTAAGAAASAIPAMVFGGRHWVAVTGAVFVADPATQSTAILGLFIDNPLPRNPKTPFPAANRSAPPPHANDDTCGLFVPYMKSRYGSANTFVSMYEWINFYWKDPYPHPKDSTATYVVLPRAHDTNCMMPASVIFEPPCPLAGTGAALRAQVRRAAMVGIQRYGLTNPKSPLSPYLAGAAPGPDDVILAEQLLPGANGVGSSQPYHLVKLRRDDCHVANIRLGARDGGILSVQAPPATIPGPPELFDIASMALERFESDIGLQSLQRVARERRFTVHPNPVWRPSFQSMSPFDTFIQINVAGGQVYADLDLVIYTNLDEMPVFR